MHAVLSASAWVRMTICRLDSSRLLLNNGGVRPGFLRRRLLCAISLACDWVHFAGGAKMEGPVRQSKVLFMSSVTS